MVCEVCGNQMHTTYRKMAKHENKEFFMCDKCHLLWAPFLNLDDSFVSDLNEKEREKALASSRSIEFDTILNTMKELIPMGGRGLKLVVHMVGF